MTRYGEVERLSPLIRRVTANNPGPFTGTGTGTHIVGNGEVAVIDPGPDDADHVDALLRATAGERITAILVTHTHRDHSPAAASLADRTGAPVVGCAPAVRSVSRETPDRFAGESLGNPSDFSPKRAKQTIAESSDAAFDPRYTPDRVLVDGDAVRSDGWTLTALATPGHASAHLAFALAEERALFTGDHVMGWSTTVIAPPDGDMGEYLDSLALLLPRDDIVYHPTHGPPVTEPHRLVRGMILHRRQREAAIVAAIGERPRTVGDLVTAMYAAIDPRLHPAAALSVTAHLIDLERRGAARREGAAWAAG